MNQTERPRVKGATELPDTVDSQALQNFRETLLSKQKLLDIEFQHILSDNLGDLYA